MKKEKTLQNLILFSFLIFNIYYFYRYVFKYNSEGTSPTYSNTPIQWQILKYVIAVLLIFALLVILYLNDVKLKPHKIEAIIFFGICFSFLKTIQQSSFDFFAKKVLFLLCAYAIVFVKDSSFERRFIKLNEGIFLYHVSYSFLQILLYLTIGRLPALAYAGGLVRFGGGWDDPNAFGIYLIIPLCYAVYMIAHTDIRKKAIKYYFVLAVSVILEVLTFSFTAYLLFCIAAIVIFCKYIHHSTVRKIVALSCVILFLSIGIFFNKIANIIQFKHGSLAIHFQNLVPCVDESLFGLFFGSNEYRFFENYYNIILYNHGLLYCICYVGLTVYFCVLGYRVQKKNSNANTFICFVFLLCYTIGQFALPYSIIFPINYIYWFFVFYIVRESRKKSIRKIEITENKDVPIQNALLFN